MHIGWDGIFAICWFLVFLVLLIVGLTLACVGVAAWKITLIVWAIWTISGLMAGVATMDNW